MIKYYCDSCAEPTDSKQIYKIAGKGAGGELVAEICPQCWTKSFTQIKSVQDADKTDTSGTQNIYSKVVDEQVQAMGNNAKG